MIVIVIGAETPNNLRKVKMQKTPKVDSPSVTARVISRILKKANFKMAIKTDEYNWTDGFYVHRIGFSKIVNIDYHVKRHALDDITKEKKLVIVSDMEKAFKFLEDKGYAIKRNRGSAEIECNNEDRF